MSAQLLRTPATPQRSGQSPEAQKRASISKFEAVAGQWPGRPRFATISRARHSGRCYLQDWLGWPMPQAARPCGPGTLRMAERLEALASQANPVNNIFLNAERAKLLRIEVARATDPQQLQTLRYSLASELLDSGQNVEALQEFEGVEQTLKQIN